MNIDFQTLSAPAKDWVFAFTWTSSDSNTSHKVHKFTVFRKCHREDAVAYIRDFFDPDIITDLDLLQVSISKPFPENV